MSRKRRQRKPGSPSKTPRRQEPARASGPPPRARTGPRVRAHDALAALLLVGLVWSIYANALAAPFVYDDYGSIVENPHVHWRELSLENARAAWLRSTTRRVVANWSFGLDYWRVGPEPRAFHATNVAIHSVAAVLVYALLCMLLRKDGGPDVDARAVRVAAWIGAAMFATYTIYLIMVFLMGGASA